MEQEIWGVFAFPDFRRFSGTVREDLGQPFAVEGLIAAEVAQSLIPPFRHFHCYVWHLIGHVMDAADAVTPLHPLPDDAGRGAV
jgi:hypothetical protein